MRERSRILLIAWATACGPVIDPEVDPGTTGTDESTSDISTETGTPQPTSADVVTTEPMDDPAPVVLTGDYLFALAVVILPETPLQWYATVVHDTSAGTVAMSLQPLSLDVGATTVPRMPVGDPLEVVAAIDPDGRFRVDFGEVAIAGATNPLTGGDLVATVVIDGTAMGRELWCGDVVGQITQPLTLDLLGSTFAFTPVTGGILHGDPVTAACP